MPTITIVENLYNASFKPHFSHLVVIPQVTLSTPTGVLQHIFLQPWGVMVTRIIHSSQLLNFNLTNKGVNLRDAIIILQQFNIHGCHQLYNKHKLCFSTFQNTCIIIYKCSTTTRKLTLGDSVHVNFSSWDSFISFYWMTNHPKVEPMIFKSWRISSSGLLEYWFPSYHNQATLVVLLGLILISSNLSLQQRQLNLMASILQHPA